MRLWMACLVTLLLSACMTSGPLAPDVAARLKQGKTAVLFYDDVGHIKYADDQFVVFAVEQRATNATYKGTWDSNSDLSALHAKHFSELGLNAQSAYTVLPVALIEQQSAAERVAYVLKPDGTMKTDLKAPSPPGQPAISPALRDALMAQGQDFLIWVAWTGFYIRDLTLGLPQQEMMYSGFWVFDLKPNQLIWQDAVVSIVTVDRLGDRNARDFLESNNLSGLKTAVAERINDHYRPDQRGDRNVGKLLGLQGVAQ